MTVLDARGVAISASPQAIATFDEAMLSLVAHRADLGRKLEATLALDGELVRAHLLMGFGQRLLAKRSLLPRAEAHLAAARRAIEACGATDGERCLAAALAASIDGDTLRAIDALEAALALEPRDLMAAKLSHALHFMLGRSSEMRSSLERILPAWDDVSLPGAGALRGCLAFALIETGELEQGEALGRVACELEPNVWSVHAVSHAHYTRRALREGAEWLAAHDGLIREASNLGLHLRWHAALLSIAAGAPHDALTTYDVFLEGRLSPDYRDFLNAASLLVRLEAAGIDVGSRWEPLSEIAFSEGSDLGLALPAVHCVIALSRAGRGAAARALASSLDRPGAGVDARVMREVALPLSRALVGMVECRRSAVLALASSLPRLGGSRVQREVFTILAASQQGPRHAPAHVSDA